MKAGHLFLLIALMMIVLIVHDVRKMSKERAEPKPEPKALFVNNGTNFIEQIGENKPTDTFGTTYTMYLTEHTRAFQIVTHKNKSYIFFVTNEGMLVNHLLEEIK